MFTRGPPSGVRALTLGVVLVLGSGSVLADRHCAPVIEAMWRARSILLQEGQTCVGALSESKPDLQEATAQAKICGYASLHNKLNTLLAGEDQAEVAVCEAKLERILEFSLELRELVEAYH